jgi:hypothetical protein
MNSQSCQARPTSFSSAAYGTKRVSSRRVSVIRRYRDDSKQQHLKEVAQLPEAPVTVKYQPPYDLDNVLPNPGEDVIRSIGSCYLPALLLPLLLVLLLPPLGAPFKGDDRPATLLLAKSPQLLAQFWLLCLFRATCLAASKQYSSVNITLS